MTDWKRTERRVAAILGGQRIPITGRARGSAPDVDAGWLVVEVKHRRRLPGWLRMAVAQATASAAEFQLPVVVLHEHGQHHANDLVVLRLRDFVDWFAN